MSQSLYHTKEIKGTKIVSMNNFKLNKLYHTKEIKGTKMVFELITA